MVNLEEDHCPKCGCLINASTGIEDENQMPSKGDISICIECASILEFNENLKLKLCSQETINRLDEDLLKVIIKARMYILNLDRN